MAHRFTIICVSVIALGALTAGTASPQIAAKGRPFVVNTHPIDGRPFQSVLPLPDGGFLVVWQEEDPGEDGTDIFARAFSRNISPVGGAFRVNSTLTGDQLGPSVAGTGTGSFVVVWNDDPSRHLVGQRFAPAAQKVGGEFQVDAGTGRPLASTVAGAGDGRFVVVWTVSGLGYSIRGRVFGADGAGEPPFSITSWGDNGAPRLASADDGFVVVWNATEFGRIRARAFDWRGAATTPEVEVAETGNTSRGAVCRNPSGNFVVAWEAYDSNPAHSGRIFYRRHDGKARPLTPALRANPEVFDPSQVTAAVACTQGEDFVLVWTDFTDVQSVAGRYFAAGSAQTTASFKIGLSDRSSDPIVAVLRDGSLIVVWTTCASRGRQCNLPGQRFVLSAAPDCPGDCNRDHSVTIDELITGVRIALDPFRNVSSLCLPMDLDLDASISVGELLVAVEKSLDGCR